LVGPLGDTHVLAADLHRPAQVPALFRRVVPMSVGGCGRSVSGWRWLTESVGDGMMTDCVAYAEPPATVPSTVSRRRQRD
jgi:hypothetical protein